MKIERAPNGLILPTAEEEEQINRGIALDPDTWEMTDEEFARLKPYALYEEERRKAGHR